MGRKPDMGEKGRGPYLSPPRSRAHYFILLICLRKRPLRRRERRGGTSVKTSHRASFEHVSPIES